MQTPQAKSIFVLGLDRILLDLLVRQPLAELQALSDKSEVKDVHGVDMQSIAMDGTAVHVLGSAVAIVELRDGEPNPGGDNVAVEIPLQFDLKLNSDLTLRERLQLSADTSSFVTS
jgi:hypothetical protein